jgi:peptidoglycan hydrolase-like protein with peptidoglycan-binding domain
MRPTARWLRRTILPLVSVTMLLSSGVGDAQAATATFPHTSHGSRGVNVMAVQHLLRSHGATIPVSGLFDNATVAAVRSFQYAHSLPGTGQVDETTWAALIVRLSVGSTGEAVVAAQRLLDAKRRAGLGLTGDYDGPTHDAVVRFQAHARITTTGIVGPVTWRALLAHFQLPAFGGGLCDYSVGNGPANWGTASAIGQLTAAAAIVKTAGYGRVPVGDIGYEHGGDIPGHQTHEQGLDVDVRPMRRANDQCRWGTNWRYASYDRAATRALVRAIRSTAIGHVKLIYFNDPVLIREGLTTWYSGHDDHLHIRYCERVHPIRRYDC